MTLRNNVVPRKLNGTEIALSGVMAAVMAVAAFIPVTVVAGVGKVISAAVMLEPLIGVLLGPILGMYAAGVGAFAGQILAPQGAIFGLLTFIPPTVGATTAGFLAHRRWKIGVAIMVATLLFWYSTKIGRQLYYYPYMLFIFLGLALTFRSNLGEWIHVKYNEIVGFKGTGIRIMILGLFLVMSGHIIFFAYTGEFFVVGIIGALLAVLFLLGYFLARNDFLRKSSLVASLAGGVILISGIVASAHGLISTLTVILILTTFFFFALVLSGYKEYYPAFLFSGTVTGISGIILLVQAPLAEIHVLQTASYLLIVAGTFLFSLVRFRKEMSLKKWSGVTLFAAGISGLVQQVLLLSSDSQVLKRELLRLEEIPFSTTVSGIELDITTLTDYYTQKVIPLYLNHIGWFLIFVALIAIGTSFFLNVSIEKLSVAYFIISGCAVLSDLMIGNFLAIQVLELNAGMFRAFLFIYPVERMFMAFFATIFGMGVLVSLKKYGIYNMIRR